MNQEPFDAAKAAQHDLDLGPSDLGPSELDFKTESGAALKPELQPELQPESQPGEANKWAKLFGKRPGQKALEVGDHLAVRMTGYRHHGIFVGDARVIHYGRGIFDLANAVVEEVDLETFSAGRPISVLSTRASFAGDEIVARARSRIGERSYDLLTNNCEHFATWCRADLIESRQVNVSETVVRQAFATVARPLAGKQLGHRAITVASLCRAPMRAPMLAAAAADVAQAAAEVIAIYRGQSAAETRKIGRRTGLASAMTIGWVCGGPATAAAVAGYWVRGQLVGDNAVDAGRQIIGKLTNRRRADGGDR